MTYIPAKEADFVEWSENLVAMSLAHKTELNLPDAKITPIQTLHDEVKALHALCQTAAYTKMDMQVKKEKKAELIHLEEVFVRNNLQNNDSMTDELRVAFRIPIHDLNPTPVPVPEGIPEIEVLTPLPRTLRFKFRGTGSKRWAKPVHVHGLELVWDILDEPPAEVPDMRHSEFATKSPLELVFEEGQRGKRIYFAARWESGTVKKGKWTDIFNAVIP
jgi:hypothetical protein